MPLHLPLIQVFIVLSHCCSNVVSILRFCLFRFHALWVGDDEIQAFPFSSSLTRWLADSYSLLVCDTVICLMFHTHPTCAPDTSLRTFSCHSLKSDFGKYENGTKYRLLKIYSGSSLVILIIYVVVLKVLGIEVTAGHLLLYLFILFYYLFL